MWPAALPLITNLLDKIIPDRGAADAAKLELVRMAQAGELAELTASTDIAKAQAATNTAEATNASIFVSGWRPCVGWICALALGFKYIGGPVLVIVGAAFGATIELPDIDAGEIMPLLVGMLGLGSLRTIEKLKDKA